MPSVIIYSQVTLLFFVAFMVSVPGVTPEKMYEAEVPLTAVYAAGTHPELFECTMHIGQLGVRLFDGPYFSAGSTDRILTGALCAD